MNRHIYGLTIFLVIVKTHFLLYWAFFAPVNFFSVEQSNFEVQKEVVEDVKSSRNRLFSPPLTVKIESAAVDVQQRKVTARLNIKNNGENWFSAPIRARLRIFTEDAQTVWTGETKLRFYASCANSVYPPNYIPPQIADFEKTSKKFAELDYRQNYYARIVILPEKNVNSDTMFSDSKEVLVIRNTD